MSDFRYDRLIEIKEKLLDQKKRHLEAALIAVQETHVKIEEVEKAIDNTYHEMTSGCYFGKEMSTMIDHISFLDNSKIKLSEEKKEKQEYVEIVRKELWDLEMDLKMLDKLRSKILSATKKAHSKKEQKLMDEIALRLEGH
jgi:flagellar export protein FliJ